MNEVQASGTCIQCYAALDPRSLYCPVCGRATKATQQALIVPGQNTTAAPYAAPAAPAYTPWPQQAPPQSVAQPYGVAAPAYYPAAPAAPAWSNAPQPMAYAPPIVVAPPATPAAAPVVIVNGDRSPAPGPVVVVSYTSHDGLSTLGSALVVWGAALTVTAICILFLVLTALSH